MKSGSKTARKRNQEQFQNITQSLAKLCLLAQ